MNAATPTAPTPDALIIPGRMRRGATTGERLDSILVFAEPMLGVDRASGRRAYVRPQGQGNAMWLFVTRDPDDTLRGPLNSPFRGQHRYDWVDRPDGIRLGYLRDIFRDAEIEKFDPLKAHAASQSICF